jgi:hypothetical protein
MSHSPLRSSRIPNEQRKTKKKCRAENLRNIVCILRHLSNIPGNPVVGLVRNKHVAEENLGKAEVEWDVGGDVDGLEVRFCCFWLGGREREIVDGGISI